MNFVGTVLFVLITPFELLANFMDAVFNPPASEKFEHLFECVGKYFLAQRDNNCEPMDIKMEKLEEKQNDEDEVAIASNSLALCTIADEFDDNDNGQLSPSA